MNKGTRAGLIVLIVQLLVVITIAGKYLYERKTCPRVWTRVAMYDPSTPLRGRYLALSLQVNVCALPRTKDFAVADYPAIRSNTGWRWHAQHLVGQNGALVAQGLTADQGNRFSRNAYVVTLEKGKPCEYGLLEDSVEEFVPEHAKTPFPLAPNTALWAEVTVPPAGNPRPIQLHTWPGPAFSSRPVGFGTVVHIR